MGSPAAQRRLSSPVPFFGHLRIALPHLGPGAPQSCLRFSPEGLPGFRPLAPGDNRPEPPRQFEPIALARQRLPAPPEAPAHRGGEGPRSTSESMGRVHVPHVADPGRGPGHIQGPSPVQRSPPGIKSPEDGTLVSQN
ncbi:hypothetical protein NDU88_003053 [Pleurodeles waltl]|uniref:Uncharacterized protein n=1 Tax=Pleurodeles waltl TaxID=8319 RepID=A0AAV7LKG5_PLEWA|nr:hypothetical protein NDU88_003053 [Pleurodeles waltl]